MLQLLPGGLRHEGKNNSGPARRRLCERNGGVLPSWHSAFSSRPRGWHGFRKSCTCYSSGSCSGLARAPARWLSTSQQSPSRLSVWCSELVSGTSSTGRTARRQEGGGRGYKRGLQGKRGGNIPLLMLATQPAQCQAGNRSLHCWTLLSCRSAGSRFSKIGLVWIGNEDTKI